jgi:hypothetical protein
MRAPCARRFLCRTQRSHFNQLIPPCGLIDPPEGIIPATGRYRNILFRIFNTISVSQVILSRFVEVAAGVLPGCKSGICCCGIQAGVKDPTRFFSCPTRFAIIRNIAQDRFRGSGVVRQGFFLLAQPPKSKGRHS